MMTDVTEFQAFLAPTDAATEDYTNQFGEVRKVARYFTRQPGPYGFLVSMPRENVIKPHFHRVDQFQLFYGAAGANYKGVPIPVGRLLLHYADAYSGYGPITTGRENLEFFTLRARLDRGIGYLPEDRDGLLRTSRHRNVYRELPLEPGPDAPAAEDVLEPDPDQLAAYRVRGRPAQVLPLPSARGSGGQYCCVIHGSVSQHGRVFGPRSLAWIGPDSPPVTLVAGPGADADVIVMQFPCPTAAGGEPAVQ